MTSRYHARLPFDDDDLAIAVCNCIKLRSGAVERNALHNLVLGQRAPSISVAKDIG
ncbi:MAG: hypothetical protein AAFR31_09290 [Cyanobacteria bacterium J06627_8]